MNEYLHTPVMLEEAVRALSPRPGGVYVDCTLGGGGHSHEILRLSSPDGMLTSIDRDARAIEAASTKLLTEFPGRLRVIKGNFHDIKELFGDMKADGILIDLGISSAQVDEPDRGFSYHADAPLDMRMDQEGGRTASDILNAYPESELAALIRDYGEERWAARIAKFIVERRPVRSTGELVKIIDAAIPAKVRGHGAHPARRTFQALRIEVNDELRPLPQAIEDCVDILIPGGILAIITFHSIEDRIVKRKFREFEHPCICPQDAPVCICGRQAKAEALWRKPLKPSADEISRNNRSRSAVLRAVRKI